jgi:hypothetical protein
MAYAWLFGVIVIVIVIVGGAWVGRFAVPQRSRSKATATRAATAAAAATHALLWAFMLHVSMLPAVPALSVTRWLTYTTLLAPMMVRMPGMRSSSASDRLLLPAALILFG